MENVDLVVLGQGGDKINGCDIFIARMKKVCRVCGDSIGVLIEAPRNAEPSTIGTPRSSATTTKPVSKRISRLASSRLSIRPFPTTASLCCRSAIAVS